MWSVSIESSVVSANDCTLYGTFGGILTLFAPGSFCLTEHANITKSAPVNTYFARSLQIMLVQSRMLDGIHTSSCVLEPLRSDFPAHCLKQE